MTRLQHPLSDADYLRIGLKLRELVTPGLTPEDAERLLTTANIKRFSMALTHRWSRTKDNLEVDEILGDKAIAYRLMRWLRRTFPEERRESVFSLIVAKFLSKDKLAQYSERLGLPELLIKPLQFERTKSDKEDLFEATMGALVILGDETFGEGAGLVLVQSIVEPIFVQEGINPANLRNYIDAVSLLKMAVNVLYNKEPHYRHKEYTTTEPDGRKTLWFTSTAFLEVPVEGKPGARVGRFEEVEYKVEELAHLEPKEAARSKQEAKEAVSLKALAAKGWTYDYIEDERQKKDAANQQRYRESLEEKIRGMRQELLSKKLTPAAFVPAKVMVRGKTKYVPVPAPATNKVQLDDDAELVRQVGPELAGQLQLPVEAQFESEKDDKGDTVVLLFTAGASGELEERGGIPVKPSQIANGYRQLVMAYVAKLRHELRLPPAPSRGT